MKNESETKDTGKQCAMQDVTNWRFWDDNGNNRIVGFLVGFIIGVLLYACL